AHAIFKRAEEETRALLSPEQREQYDKLLAEMPRFRGGRGPRDGGPRDGGPRDGGREPPPR
ncbi:MAG: hypothetical protein RMJ35_12485, partial [Phycisphaerales bacterium]|nr:hypothetical protein [Phycisphaerales bacterium]